MFKLKSIPKSISNFTNHLKFSSYNSINSYRNFKCFSSHAAPASTTTEAKSISSRFHDIYIKELGKLREQKRDLVAAKYQVKDNMTPTEGYVHPYHSGNFYTN